MVETTVGFVLEAVRVLWLTEKVCVLLSLLDGGVTTVARATTAVLVVTGQTVVEAVVLEELKKLLHWK